MEQTRNVLQRYDKMVNERFQVWNHQLVIGLASTMLFHYPVLTGIIYAANDATGQKGVDSIKRPAATSLRYYHALGQTTMTDEQLATAAYALLGDVTRNCLTNGFRLHTMCILVWNVAPVTGLGATNPWG